MVSKRDFLAALILVTTFTWAAVRGQEVGPPKVNDGPPRDRWDDPVPSRVLVRLGTTRLRHPLGVGKLLFAPDGKTLATVNEKSVRIWDAGSGKPVRSFETQGGRGLAAFFPDGKTLAVAYGDKAIRLWDVTSGQELREFGRTPGVIQSLAVSPDGKTVAAGDANGHVVLWDGVTDKKRHTPETFTSTHGVVFSPDSKTLATVGQDDMLTLWDPATGRQLHRLRGGLYTHVVTAVFSPDGKTLAEKRSGGIIRLWDVAGGKELRVLTREGDGQEMAFSADGKVLASATRSPGPALTLWDVATGQPIRQLENPSLEHSSLAFSPDGQILASWGRNSMVSLWDPATGKEFLRNGHHTPVERFVTLPDGKSAASMSSDGTLIVWDLTTGMELRRTLVPYREPGWTFSRDGTLVAAPRSWQPPFLHDVVKGQPAGGAQLERELAALHVTALGFFSGGKTLVTAEHHTGMVRLWDLAAGKELGQIQTPPHRIGGITCSPDGKTVVLECGYKQPTQLWDTTTGKEICQLPAIPHPPYPPALVFSPNGALLYRSDGRTASLYETATGNEVLQLRGRQPRGGDGRVYGAAFSPDGTILATSGTDQTIRLWDVAARKERAVLEGPKDVFDPLAFSDDSRLLAAPTSDGSSIRLWEVSTGKARATFKGEQHGISTLAFSPDGRALYSGGTDTTILKWDVTGRVKDERLPALKMEQRELERLWAALGDDDALKAHHALWALVASAEQSVPFLQSQLLPGLRPVEPKVIEGLIDDLGHDEFAARQKASSALEAYGLAAVPVLRKALEGRPPPEVRGRLERLLEKAEARLPVESTRGRRALEALEQIATPASRGVLDELIQANRDAPLAREAQAVIERLDRRPR